MIRNEAGGSVFYGLHFYPGVAQYDEPGKESSRIFLNEGTLRSMDASFAGKPIFVEHVEEVEQNLDNLRGEADGWVVESFFNEADGKHWAKFIVTSEKGKKAVKSGFKLSNAFIPKSFGQGGLWNGVTYSKEVVAAEYEHLALVTNPRYDESVIMTPDQFKDYNERQKSELARIANSKGENKMAFKLFKRAKIENTLDIENTLVELPKSKKEMLLSDVITNHDAFLNMNGYANGDHMVKVGEDEMSVNDLVKKHMDMCNEMAELKKPKEGEGGGEPGLDNDDDEMGTIDAGVKDVDSRGGDKHLANEDEVEEPDQDKKDKMKNAGAEKLAAAKLKALAVKNARADALKNSEPVAKVELSSDKVARGKLRYGSN